MNLRTIAKVAPLVPLAAVFTLLLPMSSASAADNCGDPYTYDFGDGIVWTSQTCLRNESVAGVASTIRGLGNASFSLTSAAHADVLSCTVSVTVYDANDNSPITSGSADCTFAAENNGSATADAGPTPLVSAPACVLGRHYYAASNVSMTLFSGSILGSGATWSYSVYC